MKEGSAFVVPSSKAASQAVKVETTSKRTNWNKSSNTNTAGCPQHKPNCKMQNAKKHSCKKHSCKKHSCKKHSCKLPCKLQRQETCFCIWYARTDPLQLPVEYSLPVYSNNEIQVR